MIMSVRALKTLETRKALMISRHLPFTLGSHTALRGMHCRTIQSRRATLYAEMKVPSDHKVYLNGLTGKRR